MNDAIYTFIIGLATGFTLAWIVALKWIFKKEDKELKENE